MGRWVGRKKKREAGAGMGSDRYPFSLLLNGSRFYVSIGLRNVMMKI